MTGSVVRVGRSYFKVYFRLLREMKKVHLYPAICRVSRGCYMSLLQQVKVKVAQSCLTLCDPKDYTAHGLL